MAVAQCSHRSERAPTDLISIGEACRLLGIHPNSLRSDTWQNEIAVYRIGPAAHRRYSRADVLNYVYGEAVGTSTGKKALIYGRVSTFNQKADLQRQLARLKEYADEKLSGEIVQFSDVGSGLNFLKRGLASLIDEILSGRFDESTLVVENRDRLARWGYELIEQICRHHKIEVVYTMQEEITDEELLSSDLISIITVFATRHYSKRNSERRRKTISDTTTRRCKDLLDSGLGIAATVEKLTREGHRTEKGELITNRVVRRVYLSRAKLEKVMPAVFRSSAAEYIDLFITPTDEQVRLPITAAHTHYKQWALSLDKPVIPRRHFSAMLAKRYKRSIYDGLTSFHCVKVKGQQLHFTPKKMKTSLGLNTPLDVLRAFLAKFNRPKSTSNELWPAYKAFCQERDIEPMKRETLGRVLLQIGARKSREKAGWTYILEGVL